jgi:hypothetical protein
MSREAISRSFLLEVGVFDDELMPILAGIGHLERDRLALWQRLGGRD